MKWKLIYSLHSFAGNLELLSWAIQLSVPDDQVHNVPTEIFDTKADDIATQINLINAGQIGNDLFCTN